MALCSKFETQDHLSSFLEAKYVDGEFYVATNVGIDSVTISSDFEISKDVDSKVHLASEQIAL